jgi:hypothetical protein
MNGDKKQMSGSEAGTSGRALPEKNFFEGFYSTPAQNKGSTIRIFQHHLIVSPEPGDNLGNGINIDNS